MKIILLLSLFILGLIASVDINTANIKELSTLSGISSKKAHAIVNYRSENGCFKTVDGVVKVKGIGKKTLEKNRDNLKASECKK